MIMSFNLTKITARSSLLFFFIFFQALLCADESYTPTAVYLTWQRSPDSTMTIQWVTPNNRKEDTVEYHAENQNTWNKAEGIHIPMPNQMPYFIHRIELTNLEPNTEYSFRPGNDARIFKFRTMPSDASKPIRFVVGGDMYHDSLSTLTKTSQQAASTSPMFVLIGGDIAYSTGRFRFMGEDGQRWLDWLKAWTSQMVTPNGCLIPIVPAIGNHETMGGFDQSFEQAPFFYALFPMPGVQGYNVLDFSKYMSVFILNSGHTCPIGGEQTNWLGQELKMREKIPHKIALYHVPAYPTVGDFQNSISQTIRQNWVPLFEKFGLNAAFENHCHTYKRTFPIYDGKINLAKGVLYLGDGAWGVRKTRTPKTPKETWYLAKTASIRHFILVEIQGINRRFVAIDPDGIVIDKI